jgi:hypothetical protein
LGAPSHTFEFTVWKSCVLCLNLHPRACVKFVCCQLQKKKGSCVARNSKTSLRRAVASHGFHDQRQVLGKKKKKQIMRHPGSRKPQDRFGKASLGHKKTELSYQLRQ